jgi:large subunit ribosomal protein L10
MAVTRKIKEGALLKANEIFKNSQAAVFVHFSGLGAEDARKMRAEMKKAGVEYFVTKKTLIKNAAEASDVSGDLPELNGEIALAYSSTDASAPGRLVKEFSQSLKELVSIEGGFFEGQFKSKAEMVEIANIPSLEVLRGMFVNVINSPIQRTAIALSEIAKSKA